VSPGERPEPRRLGRWLIAAACVGVVASGAIALTYSPIFRARSILVDGAGSLGERRLLRLAGVRMGDNVFHLDTHGVQRRLERDTRIEHATVSRRLPSTIAISVVERIPVAVVADPLGTTTLLVSGDGATLGPATEADRLPLLARADGGPADPGSLGTSAAASAAMPAALRAQVETILMLADGSLRLAMRSGVLVSYGPPVDLPAKARSAQALLDWAVEQRKALTSIDVSVPGAPTATLAGGGVPVV
jgi:cell division protein FtsQ